jgi:coenzyme F420-0:L-glutamate ligase / coenzyme F420-1:gamma-L-glutamate ligase
MSLHNAIFERRSVRRYRSDAVPRGIVDDVLRSAQWAPSAHNRQPWRFAVVETLERRHSLAADMGERLRRDLTADGAPRDVIEADVTRSYDRITEAPVVVVLCLSMADMDSYPDAARANHERTMAVQSTAMAGQNLLLAAYGYGLGACWMCAPLFCPEVVQAALDLPADWQPQGLITLGYPAQQRARDRKPLEDLVRWL